MKHLLSILLLCWSWEAWSQAILRNSLNTNDLSTNVVYTPATKRIRMSGATPSIELWNTSGTANFRRFLFNNATDQLRVEWSNDAGSMSLLLSTWSSDGNFAPLTLSLSGETNRLSIANDTLLLDGVEVGTSGTNNTYNNVTVTQTFIYNVAKGGHLTVYSNLTLLQSGPSKLLRTDANTNVAAVTIGSGLTFDGTTLSASGGGGGASTWVPNTALSYIGGGTNVAIDGSGGTNFYLTVTKSTWMTTPSNIPASASTNTGFTVFFKMDSTGTWPVGWTNANFKFPGGPTAAFQPDTNANAVSWVSFVMSPFTNGIFMADYGVLGSQ